VVEQGLRENLFVMETPGQFGALLEKRLSAAVVPLALSDVTKVSQAPCNDPLVSETPV